MKLGSKKLISFLLMIVIVSGVLTVAPFTVNAASFTPRTTAPDSSNAYYYSSNPFYQSGYGMPNCTCYAYGRAYELLGSKPRLSTGNAGYWWWYNKNNGIYSYGSTPRLGAIACWDKYDQNQGHVAVVEAINGNSVTISESHYKSTFFDTRTITANSSNYLTSMRFLGYIYIGDFDSNDGNNPTGSVDSITGGVGSISVKGWTFDDDDLTKSLYIHIYIGGSLATPNTEATAVLANTSRPDIDNAYHVGQFHGFDVTVPTNKTGSQDVYIYAINIGGGGNIELGHKTVYITPDTEAPKCNNKYLSQVTQNSFRVNAVLSDNVGIKNVRVATWTGNDQSDLIWHDAKFNGIDTYYLDINRGDYSATKNSYYQNHFYIYDYAGNYISVACDQDYRINSDTGKTVDNGEYRIVTSVSDSKALDVYGANTTDGTNIQIYSNLSDEKQTFDLEYIGNGFYTIFSHYSGKSLDVEGDTYQPGTNVIISGYHEGANQQWIVKPTDDGYYTIIARSNGLALDLANAKNEDCANVQVYTINNSAAQKWKLRRVINSEMVNVGNLTIDKNTLTLNPEIQVIADDNTLVLNKDYKVEIKGDIESGTGTVKVTGIGNYCDSITKSFKINSGEINVNVKNSIAYLAWDDSDSVNYYDVSIYNAETNELIATEKTEKCNIDFSLESGVYYALISSDDGSMNYRKYFYVDLDNLKNITYNNHKYILFDYSLNWNDAEQFAESIGGHLAVITSDEEQKAINNLIIQGNKNLYWIGLHDCDINGSYNWVTDNELNYTNWANGEPNNDGASSNEIYVQIYGKKIGNNPIGAWNNAEICGNPKNTNYSLDKIGFIVELSDYTEENIFDIGDINGDGTISIADATELQKHLVGLVTLSDEQLAVADTNGDGSVSVADATQIQKYITQLIPTLG